MSNNKQSRIKETLIIVGVLFFIVFAAIFKFKIWKMQHPNTPNYIFFLIKK
jgi:hypothetical protein